MVASFHRLPCPGLTVQRPPLAAVALLAPGCVAANRVRTDHTTSSLCDIDMARL